MLTGCAKDKKENRANTEVRNSGFVREAHVRVPRARTHVEAVSIWLN